MLNRCTGGDLPVFLKVGPLLANLWGGSLQTGDPWIDRRRYLGGLGGSREWNNEMGCRDVVDGGVQRVRGNYG